MSNYKIYNKDILDFLSNYKGKKFDLIITSPPYNIGKEYESTKTLQEYIDWQDSIINLCYNHLKDNSSICWQVGNYINKTGKDTEIYPLDLLLYPIFKKYNLILKNRIIWTFGHGLHCKHRFSGRYETILWFVKGNDYTFNLDNVRIPQKYPNKKYFKGKNKGKLSCNPLGKNPEDVWNIGNVKNNHPEKLDHPCQFPTELTDRLVKALSNKQDLVFDPFCGTASTGVSSINYDRKFLGVDKEKKYVNIAKERLKNIMIANKRNIF